MTPAEARELTWDQWRAAYDYLDDEAQLAFHDEVGERYPDQNHADQQAVRAFLRKIPRKVDVVEVGGWTGRLACAMLDLPRIRSWLNVEVSPYALRHQECDNPRYQTDNPGRFYWWRDEPAFAGDVLVACHVLEHFPAADVRAILACFPHARFLHAEVPLAQDETAWQGFTGTHILEWGWRDLERHLKSQGWRPFQRAGIARSYHRD